MLAILIEALLSQEEVDGEPPDKEHRRSTPGTVKKTLNYICIHERKKRLENQWAWCTPYIFVKSLFKGLKYSLYV